MHPIFNHCCYVLVCLLPKQASLCIFASIPNFQTTQSSSSNTSNDMNLTKRQKIHMICIFFQSFTATCQPLTACYSIRKRIFKPRKWSAWPGFVLISYMFHCERFEVGNVPNSYPSCSLLLRGNSIQDNVLLTK